MSSWLKINFRHICYFKIKRVLAGRPGDRGASRGKSGLHGNRMPDNIRTGQPDGQCNRKQTAKGRKVLVRAKRWGKSPPRIWQQRRHGKPHPKQDQIGTAHAPFSGCRPGRLLEVLGNKHRRGMVVTAATQYRTRLTGPPANFFIVILSAAKDLMRSFSR